MNQNYHRYWMLFISLFATVLSQWVQAKLVIEPTRPIIAMGQQIQLRVLSNQKKIQWSAQRGKIQGQGNRVTYTAPNEVGQYFVIAATENEVAKVFVTVLTEEKVAQAVTPEKSVWEVFASRNTIQALTISEDKSILWVGTNGGLEKRDAITGKLIQVFTNLDGLPSIEVNALLSESKGLWVGTSGGLVYLDNDGKWTIIGIPILTSDGSWITIDNYVVTALTKGNKGDKWIGIMGGVAHLTENGEWKVFHIQNSELPNNWVTTLASDKNGLWVGTVDGLAYLNDNEEWEVFKTDNSELPGNWIEAIVSDGNGGVWIGTSTEFPTTEMNLWEFIGSSNGESLTHLSGNGKWNIFNITNSKLPSTHVRYLVRDSNGVWVCTWGGLAYLDNKANWTIFQNDNPPSANYVEVVISNDKGRLWIGTWGNGLAYLDDETNRFSFIIKDNSDLPSNVENPDFTANIINDILRDGKGNLWIGTGNGLIYLNDDQNVLFNTKNSGLPGNAVTALLDDGNDGLWIGTEWGGLARLSSDKKWSVFNTKNSKLPHDVIHAIVSDGNSGIWMGTWGGLVHLNNHDEWTIYNTDNSKLPSNYIRTLANDGKGGIWIGGDYIDDGKGLTHLDTDGKWETFNIDNSPLPSNIIYSLVMDEENGLWVGTATSKKGSGLIFRLNNSGEWTVFDSTSLGLPEWVNYTTVTSLMIDDTRNGLWIGTLFGLYYLNDNNKLSAVFTSSNSGLPNNIILKQIGDGNAGWWIGTNGGLTHLTFSQKPFLCEKTNVPDMTDEQCADLLKGSRSAILIHPNGQGSGYNQDYATEVMATHAYQTLFYGRGYDIDEIYFLSYKPDPDFNGDGIADLIVTAPVTLAEFRNKVPPRDLTLEDLTQAFDWAKEKSLEAQAAGLPEQPLVVIFIDHGLPHQLLLSPTTPLEDVILNRLIEDYQVTTGNQAIIIMEACYTGTLITGLQANDRVIISSTGQDKSYYSDYGRSSFTQFYFDELYRGTDYSNGVKFVKNKVFAELGPPLNQQTPYLEDLAQGQRASKLCLNGCFGSRKVPELTPQVSSKQVTIGGTVKLAVAIKENDNTVTRVETSIVTPKDARERNEQGFSLNPPMIKHLTDPEKDGIWEYEFKEFTEPGEYTFLFKAEYKIDIGRRTFNAPQAITVCVEPCQRTDAYFEVTTGILHLPAVEVSSDNGDITVYQADLLLQPDVKPLTLQLEMNSVKQLGKSHSVTHSLFDPKRGIVQIPIIHLPDHITEELEPYRVKLQLIPGTSPLKFTVEELNKL